MSFFSRLLVLAVALSALTLSVAAQKTWEKPYHKWNKDDAMKVVTASPWATTYQSPESAAAASQAGIARDSRDTANRGGGGATGGSISRNGAAAPVVLRFHSGLPIREAIVRGRELAAGYDKMDEQKKKEFDESNKGFLECKICQNYYVVSITKMPDPSGDYVDEAIFQRSSLDDLKGNVSLTNDKGDERELVQFTPPKRPGDSAYFFFARVDDSGKPLITPENSEIKINFKNNFFTGSNPYAGFLSRSFDFKISKMMIGNDLML